MSHKKASQLKAGNIQRAKRKLKINDEHRAEINEYYHRSDISRLQPGESTKKYGPTSYMRVTGKCAYDKFREQHPLIKIGLSVFCDLRGPVGFELGCVFPFKTVNLSTFQSDV